jgi:hypothetical protein
VIAFILSLGFQLKHKATCSGGGCLTRHSHYLRVRLGGVTIWRLQCTTCHAVFTVLPHFIWFCRKVRFLDKIQKFCVRNSMTYRLPNSRKSNFATEPHNVGATHIPHPFGTS